MKQEELLWSAKKKESLLRGNLRDFHFPSLLAYLHKTGSTGILTISRDRIEKHVFIRNGVPCSARSNLKTERLGEMLFSQGVISRQQQQRVLETQKKNKTRFAVSLIQEGLISRHNLFIQSRRLFLSILYSLFGLSEGIYRFEEIDITQDVYCFKVAFPNLMIFGIRQIWDPQILYSMAGELDQVPVKTERFSDIQTLRFTEQELLVTRAIDSARSILEVIDASGLEILSALKTLIIMLHLEQIQFASSPETEGTEPMIDIEKSEEALLGFKKYQSCDPKDEQAVAGDDFLVPPEGAPPLSPVQGSVTETSGDSLGPFPWIEIARTSQKQDPESQIMETEENKLENSQDSDSPSGPLIEGEEEIAAWDSQNLHEDPDEPDDTAETSMSSSMEMPGEADGTREKAVMATSISPSSEKSEPEVDFEETETPKVETAPQFERPPRKKPASRKSVGLLYVMALVLTGAFGLFSMTPWSSDLKDRLFSIIYNTDSGTVDSMPSDQVPEDQSMTSFAFEESKDSAPEVPTAENMPMNIIPETMDSVTVTYDQIQAEDLPKDEISSSMDLAETDRPMEKSVLEKEVTVPAPPPVDPMDTLSPSPEKVDTPSAFAQVIGIHHEMENDYVRVIIDLDKPVNYKKYEFADKNMIFLSLKNTRLSPNLNKASVPVSGHRLKRIRLGQYKPDIARVVLDLEKMSNVSLFSLEDPFRILLIVSDN